MEPRGKKPADINQLMFGSSNRDLASVLSHADHLGELAQAFRRCLPEDLRRFVYLMNIEGEQLMLGTHSGAMATALRLRNEELIAAVRRCPELKGVTRYTMQVVPRSDVRKPAVVRPTLSKENAHLLIQEAGNTKDKELKRALEELARHGLS